MKDTALHPVAADYRVEVARILADLPAVEAEEILDDVEVNLSEVVAELDGAVTSDALRARLGTPHEYAAELRAAAGYPPLTPPGGGGRLRGVGKVELLMLGLLVALGAAFVTGVALGSQQDGQERWWIFPCVLALAVEAVNALWLRGRERGLPEVAALSVTRRARALGESLRTGRFAEPARFLTGLRSAWWVLRALVVSLLAWVITGGVWWPVAVGILALAGSLWLGSRSGHDRRLVWLAVPLNAMVVGLGIGMVSGGQFEPGETVRFEPSGSNYPTFYSSSDGHPLESSTLMGTLDGRPLQNIYPFDAQGRPLKDVLLFDQNGKQLGLYSGLSNYGCTPDGRPMVPNRESLPFPQPRVEPNRGAPGCRIVEGTAPFTIAIPVRPGQVPPASTPPSAGVPGNPPATVPNTPPGTAPGAAPGADPGADPGATQQQQPPAASPGAPSTRPEGEAQMPGNPPGTSGS
ncbi:HAAS signaling domain-containing protein [Embleya sp. NPDC020630]|uniref:HAAS signaling domain-containing protein n=1 Tax=Embleya sp. NPDC020630 TaxID=3363979 RepID=UPI0037B90EC1